MAGEIKYLGPGTGRTCYVRVLGSGTSVWSITSGYWENYGAANWTDYKLASTEQGSTNLYISNFPSTIVAGVYDVEARQQMGGTAAVNDPGVAAGQVEWNGDKRLPLSDLVTSGQLSTAMPRLTRGVALSGFQFKLVSAADHVTAFVSGVVSGQINRDGTGWGALQSGVFTETGFGWYKVNFTSGDLLANSVALHFTANGISGGTSDPRDIGIVMQRSSGSV